MQQSLLNAECASGEYLNAGEKNMHVCRGHESAHKGVPASAGKLFLHISLPSTEVFRL